MSCEKSETEPSSSKSDSFSKEANFCFILSTIMGLCSTASTLGGLFFLRCGHRDGFVSSMLFSVLMAVQSEGFSRRGQIIVLRKELNELNKEKA